MKVGKLQLITGPMFSGKTDQLITEIREEYLKGRRVIAFRPMRDSRETRSVLASRSGRTWPAVRLDRIRSLSGRSGRVDVIALDEVHMWTPSASVVEVCTSLVSRGIDVWVAGLDLDFLGRPFEPVASIMRRADTICFMQAKCECGELATHSIRLVDSDELVVVGDSDKYRAACRFCHGAHLRRLEQVAASAC